MKSYKCSKAEVHRVLANVLKNAPAKTKRKKTNDRSREEEDGEESETESRHDDEENLTDL